MKLMFEIKSLSADEESNIDKLKTAIDNLMDYPPNEENRMSVTTSQLNRIMSAFLEQHTDIQKNFLIHLTGTQFPRLLKYFKFDRVNPNQISIMNVKSVSNSYTHLLSQLLKDGARAKNIYLSGVEIVKELPVAEKRGVAENLVFETDQELYEAFMIYSCTENVSFINCKFKNPFSQILDFIPDLQIKKLEFESCDITVDIAEKIITTIVCSSNLLQSLCVLNFFELADKPQDESRYEEFTKLLGTINYNVLPFQWDLTRKIPPMVFIEENLVARNESDGYRTFFVDRKPPK